MLFNCNQDTNMLAHFHVRVHVRVRARVRVWVWMRMHERCECVRLRVCVCTLLGSEFKLVFLFLSGVRMPRRRCAGDVRV
jgi:hypothetical protein